MAAVGVAAAVVGSVVLNLGVNMQKLSLRRNLELPLAQQRPYFRQRLWLLGMAVFLGGNLSDLVAFNFVSPAVTTPLGSVSLISNVFFGWWLLGDPVDRFLLLATAAMLLGAVLTTVFAVRGAQEEEYTAARLRARLSQGSYVAYTVCVLALAVASFVYFQRVFRYLRSRSASGRVREFSSLLSPRQLFLTRLALPTFAALVASQTVLFVKASVKLVSYSFQRESQLDEALTWISIGVAVLSAITQVHYLQVGLKYFSSSWIVPVFYVSWTLSSITGSGIVYRDFAHFRAATYALFALGLALIFFGVWQLSSSVAARPDAAAERPAVVDSAEREIGLPVTSARRGKGAGNGDEEDAAFMARSELAIAEESQEQEE
jgi:hypothetical protein